MARLPKLHREQGPSLAAIKRQRTARLTKLATRAAMLQRRGRNDEAYTLVCNEFVELGGIYVKFLQGVLLNSPIMKRWHSADKLRIFEAIPPEPITITHLLQQQLSPDSLRQIARLQTEPFAAGSFGQVYYGELQNGQPIIVKALRPQVRELLQHDLRLLGLFSRFFMSRQYKHFNLKLDDAIKDFRRATLAETDYLREAEFAAEIYKAYEHTPGMVIPRTYRELSTPQIIVQDFVGGVSCAEVLRKYDSEGIQPTEYVHAQLGSDLSAQLETLGVALLDSCFTQPRVMGDPHPGNVRLLPDNKIALIDFGISAAAPRNRAAFYGLIREWSHMYTNTLDIPKLFEQFLRLFVNDLYRALKKLTSLYPSGQNKTQQSLMKNVGGVINELFDDESDAIDMNETMSQGRLIRLFNQVINKGNRLGLNIRLDDTDLLRAAQTYMSMVEALGLRAEVLAVVFERVVTENEGEHTDFASTTERAVSTSQAFEIVNSWLERIASKDPMLFRRMLQQIARSGNDATQLAKTIVNKSTKPPQEEQHA